MSLCIEPVGSHVSRHHKSNNLGSLYWFVSPLNGYIALLPRRPLSRKLRRPGIFSPSRTLPAYRKDSAFAWLEERERDVPDVLAAIAPRKPAVFSGVKPVGQEVTLSRLRREYGDSPAENVVRDGRNSSSRQFSSLSLRRELQSNQFGPHLTPGKQGYNST